MKKISLVELSQMEVKPKKVKYKWLLFRYSNERKEYIHKGKCYNDITILSSVIRFYELNEPLIELGLEE